MIKSLKYFKLLKHSLNKEIHNNKDIKKFSFKVNLFNPNLTRFVDLISIINTNRNLFKGKLMALYLSGYRAELVQYNVEDNLNINITDIPQLLKLVTKCNATLILRGLEKLLISNKYYKFFENNLNRKSNSHLFYSCKNSLSFDLHTDPCFVVIYCISGSKEFLIQDPNSGVDYTYKLTEGDWLFIPTNFPHKAKTLEDHTFIISIGIYNGEVED